MKRFMDERENKYQQAINIVARCQFRDISFEGILYHFVGREIKKYKTIFVNSNGIHPDINKIDYREKGYDVFCAFYYNPNKKNWIINLYSKEHIDLDKITKCHGGDVDESGEFIEYDDINYFLVTIDPEIEHYRFAPSPTKSKKSEH